MGMGEPLDNYDEVIMAISGMTDVRRFSLSPQRICISTVGVVPRLRQLAKSDIAVCVAISLHAPTQELREQIVPSAKAYSLTSLIKATHDLIQIQKQRSRKMERDQVILMQYVLIADVNDTPQVAAQVGALLGYGSLLHDKVMLNLIPYNPTEVPFDYRPPSIEAIDRFVSVVKESGVRVTVRQELGQDIASACGQLVVDKVSKEKKRKKEEPDERDGKHATGDAPKRGEGEVKRDGLINGKEGELGLEGCCDKESVGKEGCRDVESVATETRRREASYGGVIDTPSEPKVRVGGERITSQAADTRITTTPSSLRSLTSLTGCGIVSLIVAVVVMTRYLSKRAR
eukprot:GHVN01030976.1.p1 GENE.GHVN01030976.1~~GHVN01030976.1.p1  ORF type:complete len:344 (-),score=95.93 GHVN01030976.1:221-1252(-)